MKPRTLAPPPSVAPRSPGPLKGPRAAGPHRPTEAARSLQSSPRRTPAPPDPPQTRHTCTRNTAPQARPCAEGCGPGGGRRSQGRSQGHAHSPSRLSRGPRKTRPQLPRPRERGADGPPPRRREKGRRGLRGGAAALTGRGLRAQGAPQAAGGEVSAGGAPRRRHLGHVTAGPARRAVTSLRTPRPPRALSAVLKAQARGRGRGEAPAARRRDPVRLSDCPARTPVSVPDAKERAPETRQPSVCRGSVRVLVGKTGAYLKSHCLGLS